MVDPTWSAFISYFIATNRGGVLARIVYTIPAGGWACAMPFTVTVKGVEGR